MDEKTGPRQYSHSEIVSKKTIVFLHRLSAPYPNRAKSLFM